ncbi:MAG: hypothetical protein WCI47_02720 [bacterium]
MFSITFFSVILVLAATSFIGVLAIYNRTQGLTRTQLQARVAIDALTRDLRSTESVNIATVDADTATAIANGKLPAGSTKSYCLTGKGFSKGYAMIPIAGPDYTTKLHLIRMQSCNTLANYELLVGPDVWSDVQAPGTTIQSPCVAFSIKSAVHDGTISPVWNVAVSAQRGNHVPCDNSNDANNRDSLSASTILQTIVSHE